VHRPGEESSMESKEGVMQKLRRFFGGGVKQKEASPAMTEPVMPSSAPAETVAAAPVAEVEQVAPPMPPEQMVQEQARFLCSDVWLANRITVKAEARDGKTYLSGSPAEAAPYIRAAYQAKKDKLPDDVLLS
jgi:hypothetical protein